MSAARQTEVMNLGIRSCREEGWVTVQQNNVRFTANSARGPSNGRNRLITAEGMTVALVVGAAHLFGAQWRHGRHEGDEAENREALWLPSHDDSRE